MNRRTALAAAAAVSLSITGLAAAAGATMHVFDAAEASPNVGTVSPVSPTTTQPPEVEHHLVVVDDPAPEAPAPAPSGATHESQEVRTPPAPSTTTAAPTPPPPPAPSPPPAGPDSSREFGDD